MLTAFNVMSAYRTRLFNSGCLNRLLKIHRQFSGESTIKMAHNTFVQLPNGRKMPLVGLGTWKSDPSEVAFAVKTAIDVGYRHIDCALCYENEEQVGDGINAKIADGTVTREELFVTSKLFEAFHKLEDVETGLKKTLKSLKLDYLDLYLIHWPFGIPLIGDELYPKDANGETLFSDVHFTETWRGMEKMVEKGLVKSIGVSNFNISQLKEILAIPNKVEISNNQIELSPYLVQSELVDFCKANSITVTAYSPLGSPDREDPQEGEPVLMEDKKLVDLAKRKGKSVAQMLIRYHLQQNIACIPKSVTPARIKENFESLSFQLTSDEIKDMKSLNRNHRYCTYYEAFGHPLHPFDPTQDGK